MKQYTNIYFPREHLTNLLYLTKQCIFRKFSITFLEVLPKRKEPQDYENGSAAKARTCLRFDLHLLLALHREQAYRISVPERLRFAAPAFPVPYR